MSDTANAARRKKMIRILLAILLLATGMVVALDIAVGWGIYRQWRSEDYASTTGVLLRSEVHERRSDGRTYRRGDLHYRYEVDGRTYEGTRYRFGVFSGRGVGFARSHEVGDDVEVFYDPYAPGRALLSPGIEGSDVLAALFAAPFTGFLMLIGYGYLVGMRPYGSGPGGLREAMAEDGAALEYRPTDEVFWGLMALTFGGFGALVLLLLNGSSMQVSLEAATSAVVGVVVLAGAVAAAGFMHRLYGRRKRILVDYAGRVLTVPTRGGPRTMRFERVDEIRVQQGQPIVVYRDGKDERPRLVKLPALRRAGARELAEWLRREVRLGDGAGAARR